MKSIDLVIFDMAGTTIEDRGEVPKAFMAALQKNNISMGEDFIRKWRGASKKEVLRQSVESQFGKGDLLNPGRVEQAYEDFRTLLEGSYEREGIHPISGADETFHWLRSQGIKIALTTGFYRKLTDIILRAVGWKEGIIDASLCSDDVALGRPAPYMIFRAMEIARVTDINRVINVGDTALDLLSAANAGVRGNIGVLSGSQKIDQLGRVKHTHIIPTAAELPELLKKEFL